MALNNSQVGDALKISESRAKIKTDKIRLNGGVRKKKRTVKWSAFISFSEEIVIDIIIDIIFIVIIAGQ